MTIEVSGLTKRFGPRTGGVLAVDDLSFTVQPGRVTGFLGPNGAGKTTTLRCVLGLVAPTSGTATIDGRTYAELDDPIGAVGASLESSDFHPGRTARDHLRTMAIAAGLPESRVGAVLAMTGMEEYAGRRVGGFSLGMRQRLALASAMLGDPRVLVLDEPANGLDPAGIAWLRTFLRELARDGRTVLVSSHVLSEVQQTVDEVVVITQGRLVRQGSLAELEDGETAVLVRTPTPEILRAALVGWKVTPVEGTADGFLRVAGATVEQVGHQAFASGVELHELTREQGDLERIFLELTGGAS